MTYTLFVNYNIFVLIGFRIIYLYGSVTKIHYIDYIYYKYMQSYKINYRYWTTIELFEYNDYFY